MIQHVKKELEALKEFLWQLKFPYKKLNVFLSDKEKQNLNNLKKRKNIK